MRIAIASMASRPSEFSDDDRIVELLRARGVNASVEVAHCLRWRPRHRPVRSRPIDQATKLVAAIGASGRTAMVQPYLPSVDSEGEIAIVFIDGEPAHALRKRAVLRPGEIAPVRADPVGAAEAMYDPHLVRAATATEAELESATAVVAELARRSQVFRFTSA